MESEIASSDTEQYEESFLQQYSKMGFQSEEQTKIEEVEFSFRKSESSSCDYSFKHDGTLKLFVENRTPEDGLKHALARIVYDVKTHYVDAMIRRTWLPLLLPFFTLLIPVFLLQYTAGILSLAILIGPVLYSIVTVSLLSVLTKLKSNDEEKVRRRTQEYLERTTIFSDNDIDEWIRFITGYRFIYYILDYVTFVFFLVIITWLVIFVM